MIELTISIANQPSPSECSQRRCEGGQERQHPEWHVPHHYGPEDAKKSDDDNVAKVRSQIELHHGPEPRQGDHRGPAGHVPLPQLKSIIITAEWSNRQRIFRYFRFRCRTDERSILSIDASTVAAVVFRRCLQKQ